MEKCSINGVNTSKHYFLPSPRGGGVSGGLNRYELDLCDLIDDVAKQHVKHTLFPAISYLLVPPKTFADNAVVKLANLNSLYKVFERC